MTHPVGFLCVAQEMKWGVHKMRAWGDCVVVVVVVVVVAVVVVGIFHGGAQCVSGIRIA